jgi:hypothetical protein
LLRVMAGAGLAVLETDILHRAIKEMRGDQGEVLLGLLEDEAQGGAPSDEAAAGGRSATHGHDRCIAVHHLDVCRRHAQRIGHHLGKNRGGALAMGRKPGVDRDLAPWLDYDPGVIGEARHTAAGAFDDRGQTDTDEGRPVDGNGCASGGNLTAPGRGPRRARTARSRRSGR